MNGHLVREKHGIEIYRCVLSGCHGFRFPYRTEIGKFVQFLKELPKIPIKLPLSGALHSDEEIARRLNSDPRTINKYFEVVEGLDLDGVPAYTKADSRILIYLDDAPPEISKEGSWLKCTKCGELIDITGYPSYVVCKCGQEYRRPEINWLNVGLRAVWEAIKFGVPATLGGATVGYLLDGKDRRRGAETVAKAMPFP